jgi:uncharacterized protein (TIGR04255 family)
MSYNKPILTEIFSELYLEQSTLSPSLFFELVPALKKCGFTQIEFAEAANLQSTQFGRQLTRVPRVRCWSDDRRRLVQLSPDLVVANQVGEYLGWQAFRELFSSVKSVLQSQSLLRVRSLSLNTTDQLKVPATGFVLGAYLECGGTMIPSWFKQASGPADIIYGKGDVATDGFNRQLQLSVQRNSSEMLLRAQLIFHDRVSAPDDLESKLEGLHQESNQSFESLITDRVRHLMGGTK